MFKNHRYRIEKHLIKILSFFIIIIGIVSLSIDAIFYIGDKASSFVVNLGSSFISSGLIMLLIEYIIKDFIKDDVVVETFESRDSYYSYVRYRLKNIKTIYSFHGNPDTVREDEDTNSFYLLIKERLEKKDLKYFRIFTNGETNHVWDRLKKVNLEAYTTYFPYHIDSVSICKTELISIMIFDSNEVLFGGMTNDEINHAFSIKNQRIATYFRNYLISLQKLDKTKSIRNSEGVDNYYIDEQKRKTLKEKRCTDDI